MMLVALCSCPFLLAAQRHKEQMFAICMPTSLSTVESSTFIFEHLFWEPFMHVQVHIGSKGVGCGKLQWKSIFTCEKNHLN